MRTSVYLSLGSNLGDRLETLKTAVILINELPETTVYKCSDVYETEPALVDPKDGSEPEEQPPYANMVVHIKTGLGSDELFRHLSMIESDLGRVRLYPNSPRTLDIDILLFGDQAIENDQLTVPHPRMLERDFVMTPLLEIAGETTLPDGRPLTKERAKKGAVIASLGAIALPL